MITGFPASGVGILRSGILLPETVLASPWFTVLAAFVAVNTVIYVCLALLKIFPAPNLSRHVRRGRQRRAETRSIYPEPSRRPDSRVEA